MLLGHRAIRGAAPAANHGAAEQLGAPEQRSAPEAAGAGGLAGPGEGIGCAGTSPARWHIIIWNDSIYQIAAEARRT